MRDGAARRALPTAAVTGIGSLPFHDPDHAIRFVASHAPLVPFWPQLPARGPSEGMLRQAIGVGAGLLDSTDGGGLRVRRSACDELLDRLHDDDVALDAEDAAGFGPFVRALQRGQFPSAVVVKGQLAGPLTLLRALSPDGDVAPLDRVLVDAIVQRVARRAAWQVQTLGGTGLPVLLSVDEPVLGMLDDPAVQMDLLDTVMAAISREGGTPMLHTCATRGPVPVPAATQVLSLDLHARGHDLPDGVRDWWGRGGILAAGLVPTSGTSPDPERLAQAWGAIRPPVDHMGDGPPRTLITSTCGLAGLTEQAAVDSFAVATAVAARIEVDCAAADVASRQVRR